MPAASHRRAIAIAAHPDDIEFLMAGTLLLLKEHGFEIHYLNLSSGNCGSMVTDPAETRRIRKAEAQEAARILGATFHESICDDLEIFYEIDTLRRLAAIVREVGPEIVLTHSPHDYMEDHTNTARLAVTATFSMGMPNFLTDPPRSAVQIDRTIYHAMPHGLRDGLRHEIIPDLYVDTATVHKTKRRALAAHASQKDWLDITQGMDSYLAAMDDMAIELGWKSNFKYAEAWRRHLHLGLSGREIDPLTAVLDTYTRDVSGNKT